MAYSSGSDVGVCLSFSTDDPAVASAYSSIASRVLRREDSKISLMGTFMGLLGTYALINQYQLLERQTDMNEDMVGYAERYLNLAEDNYSDITLNAYNKMVDLYDHFTTSFQPFEKTFLDQARSVLTYTADYDTAEGRAMAGVGQQYSLVRQRRARQRSRYAVGACCSEDLLLDIAQANALVDASNRGYRYEDEKKLKLDDWYWQHYSQAIQLVENMRANVITGLNGGVAGATQGLGAIAGMMQTANSAVSNMGNAIDNQASFFGTVSNGAFRMMGFNDGRSQVPSGYGPITSALGSTRGGFGGTALGSLAIAPAGGLNMGYDILNTMGTNFQSAMTGY